MGWLIEGAALSLVIWIPCIVLQVRNRLRMEDLQATIRAQRKCMDNMEQELSSGYRKVGEPARKRPRGLGLSATLPQLAASNLSSAIASATASNPPPISGGRIREENSGGAAVSGASGAKG
jgi:hypothetical protein